MASLAASLNDGSDECTLEPLDAATLASIEALAAATLNEKHATNLMGVLREPCSKMKQGMLTMGFKMKNTAAPLATVMTDILNSVEAPCVAEMWTLLPREPRTWMLKAFINSLPCRVSPGATKCDEEETNLVLARFEESRFEFTQRRLAEAGMAPFPTEVAEQSTSGEDNVQQAMERYVKRLGIEGEAAAWVLSEFKAAPRQDNATNQTLTIEPAWFSGIASRCRIQAHAQVPDVRDADETAELADLDAATRVAMWAWHYKDCHRTLVLSAFEIKDQLPADPQPSSPDPAANDAAGVSTDEL